MRDLRGRTALVTGAAGGIGAALAERLHAAGMQLVLADVDEAALAPLAHRLGARALTLDVRHAEAWEAAAAALDDLDLLVHNAGLTVHAPVDHLDPEDLDLVLDVDLRGPMLGTRILLPFLRRSRGAHVVLVSSMAALTGMPFQAPYSAAKAGLRAYGQALRVELAADGIGVTTVMPGTIATPFLARARGSDGAHREALAPLMLRFGTSPGRVASRIERAVRRNRAELLVGWDAHLLAWVVRRFPSVVPAILRRAYPRVRPPPRALP